MEAANTSRSGRLPQLLTDPRFNFHLQQPNTETQCRWFLPYPARRLVAFSLLLCLTRSSRRKSIRCISV